MAAPEKLADGPLTPRQAGAGAGDAFRRGWRPAAGWVCVAALALHYVIGPTVRFVLSSVGVTVPPVPELDVPAVVGILAGLLGLGAMRTTERLKDKA